MLLGDRGMRMVSLPFITAIYLMLNGPHEGQLPYRIGVDPKDVTNRTYSFP